MALLYIARSSGRFPRGFGARSRVGGQFL